MKAKDKHLGLTAERLREVLRYNSGSGLFIWRKKPHKSMSSVNVDDIAGSIDSTGYIRIWIDGKRYVAHRLAWLHFYGSWPEDQLDHVNGNRADNRIINLREASASQNSMNCMVRRTNKAGIKGIRKHESGRYQARIWDGEKNIHLGLFDTEEEAKAMYVAAAATIFGKFARAK